MMWEQIRSNQIRSTLLVVGMGVLLLLIGYFLGLYFIGDGIRPDYRLRYLGHLEPDRLFPGR